MITQISYNVLIERFKAFAAGHYLIEGFTHGHPSAIDIQKDITFPWMHVFPLEVEPRAGSRLYSFIITFADLPRDKETPAEYQREVISDCIKLAEDFVAEVQNGLTLFGPTVELEGSPSIEVFIDEYSQTLTGVNLAVTLSVPWDWSACDIPADFAVGGSGSGGGGAGGGGIVLKTNGVLNGSQSILDLVEGTNITLTDNGSGVVTISASGGGGGGSVTSVGLSAPSAFTVSGSPITTSGTLALSGAGTSLEYIDGAGDLQTFPVLAAVATSGDYNDLSNLPTIPTALNDLSDVNAPTPSNGQTLIYNSASGDWEATTPASGGTVTSVALTMPAAFSVAGSPVTTAGTLAVTGSGNGSQYIDGTGALQTFPSISAGTVTSVGLTSSTSGLTIGSSPVTTSGNITLAIATATAAQNGLLSSADWATFNNRKDTFTIRAAVGPFAPADNITYYFSEQGLTASQIATIWDAIIPFDCILVAASIYAGNTAGVATAEASTVNFRLNNATDTLLSNAVIFGGAVPVGNAYSITGLSTNLLAGNTFVIKWTTPAWVTNPTSAQLLITLFFERI